MLTRSQRKLYTVLPGGRVHGLISQKRPQKKIGGREKLEAGNYPEGGRNCSKEAVEIFFSRFFK